MGQTPTRSTILRAAKKHFTKSSRKRTNKADTKEDDDASGTDRLDKKLEPQEDLATSESESTDDMKLLSSEENVA